MENRMKSLTLGEFRKLTAHLGDETIIVTPDNEDEAFSIGMETGFVCFDAHAGNSYFTNIEAPLTGQPAIALSELWSEF